MKLNIVSAICFLFFIVGCNSSTGHSPGVQSNENTPTHGADDSNAEKLDLSPIGSQYSFTCDTEGSIAGKFVFKSHDTRLSKGDGNWIEGFSIEVLSLAVRENGFSQNTSKTLTGTAQCWNYNASRPGSFVCKAVTSSTGFVYTLEINWDESITPKIWVNFPSKSYTGNCVTTRIE